MMNTFTYGMIRKIFNVATYGVLGMEVIGEENIPEKGPFLVVCNIPQPPHGLVPALCPYLSGPPRPHRPQSRHRVLPGLEERRGPGNLS